MATPTNYSEPENVGNTLDKNLGRASAAAHGTLDKVAEAARPAMDSALNSAHEAVDTIASRTARAAEMMGAKGAELKVQQEQSLEQMRASVRRSPLTALGIAAGVGFVLAKLLR